MEKQTTEESQITKEEIVLWKIISAFSVKRLRFEHEKNSERELGYKKRISHLKNSLSIIADQKPDWP